MSELTLQPDLIITLSNDEVRLNLSPDSATGRQGWQASFNIESTFLEEQISASMDQALQENSTLFDPFSCVEIVWIDRPNIFVPHLYTDRGALSDIASRYLRIRAGDFITADIPVHDKVICYSIPSRTISTLQEYYANATYHHLCSILWNHFSSQYTRPEPGKSRLYFTLTGKTLIVLVEQNNELIFSRNFIIRDQGDMHYYTVACARMLNPDEKWLATFHDETGKFEMPGNSILTIEDRLSLPPIHILLSQYKVCAS